MSPNAAAFEREQSKHHVAAISAKSAVRVMLALASSAVVSVEAALDHSNTFVARVHRYNLARGPAALFARQSTRIGHRLQKAALVTSSVMGEDELTDLV